MDFVCLVQSLFRSSGWVVPPLAAKRSLTNEFILQSCFIEMLIA